jgi:hypothetical protein
MYMRIDSFIFSSEARKEFAQRRADVFTSADYYGILHKPIAAIGTGALAAFDLDGHAALPDEDPFDLDAVDFGGNSTIRGKHFSDDAPLPLTMLASRTLVAITPMYGSAEDVCNSTLVTPDGLRAVAPTHAAAGKLQRGSIKDVVGVLQAHIVANAEGHPVVESDNWHMVVGIALGMCSDWDPRPSCLPDWAVEITEGSVIQHEAFRNISVLDPEAIWDYKPSNSGS